MASAAGACVKCVPRSALAAFAPEAPYLAAGTMAGAVDLSFSSSANLEIFKLDLQSEGHELPAAGAACPSGERFHRLSWSRPPPSPSEDYPLGLVAGGLVDGAVGVWNPIRLISASSDEVEDALVARLEKHRGPVRGLEFCSLQPNLLASGADEGELCIWDVGKPSEPNLFPTLKTGGQSEVSFVSWNPKFQPILASTSYNGVTVVWDLRQQKPVTSLSDSRRCTVLQWNPDMSTQLIIAADAGNLSSLRLWDVRRAIAPLKEFVGHTDGVIAMSWCPSDSLYLLTCAKDNRTICWDTVNGEIVRELPPSTSCNFDVHWCPKIPGIISASSFDVKIGIYNIEACSRLAVADGNFQYPAPLRAPKWLKRPVGVSFGFGGKVVLLRPSLSAPGASTCGSEVYLHSLVTESSLVSRSTEFEAAIQHGEKASLRALCEKKYLESESGDDKETWGFLKIMFEEDGTARTKLLAHLGFSVTNESEGVADELSEDLTNNLTLDQKTGEATSIGSGGFGAFDIDNGEDFFNNPLPSSDGLAVEASHAPTADQIHNEPDKAIESTDSSFDDSIRHALIVGDYKGAVSQCISADRMADALVIAHLGGASLWESTRDRYLRKSNLSYLKVVSAMVKNDLVALVNTRPLDSWKETLALLCTFAQKDEWTVLCDILASKLMDVKNTLAATLCYICSGNINKAVEIWSRSLKPQHEGRSYVDLLQDLMEKMVVLTLATGQKQFSPSLSKLIENYAELLASQGLLRTAMEYLKLLGAEQFSNELDILRDRIEGSAEEKAATAPTENAVSKQPPVYGTDQPNFGLGSSSQQYYQGNQPPPQQGISGVPYGQGYQQPFVPPYGAYQPAQPPQQQFQDFGNSSQIHGSPSPMFIPLQEQQGAPAPGIGASQPPMNFFVPAPAPTLKNAEQYQQNTLASHLYAGARDLTYQAGHPGNVSLGAGLPQEGPVPSHKIPQPAVPNPAPRGFTPVPSSAFVPRSSISPVQSTNPTQTTQVQPASAPPAPQPTVQKVDTSNVSAELRPVIATLTRLYNETSDALGGARANAAKKREIEDNSRKIGALFAKLNSGDISPNASSKLVQLCQALDSGDYASALHIQVVLTTSDWDECNFWLAALKRMIKTRQTVR